MSEKFTSVRRGNCSCHVLYYLFKEVEVPRPNHFVRTSFKEIYTYIPTVDLDTKRDSFKYLIKSLIITFTKILSKRTDLLIKS